MASDQMPATIKQAPVSTTGVRVGGGIITADMPAKPKPTKRGTRVGGGIITADMP